MSIIFFRFFLLFSVVANSVGAQDSAPSGLLADSHQLSTLAFATKILYEIMLVRIFCNFSFFFTQFFWLMGWVGELFCGFLRFQLLFFFWIFSAFGFGLGAVLGISAVSATFFWIFSAFGLILGAVLKVLWITAPQGPAYYAINLWLLYIMLI